MARAESKMIMGYLPIEEHHHEAILSLVKPATPDIRMLDPFAGDGLFLEVASKAWNVTPYANELDGERAHRCLERFGPKQAVRCDVERLNTSLESFSVIWGNPPYDHDRAAKDNKRIEFIYLRHSWKWLMEGGLYLWVVYTQHLTESAAGFLAKNSSHMDVWALPGKHLQEYDQIVVAAVKGKHPAPGTLYNDIIAAKPQPRLLTKQDEPLYQLPHPQTQRKFIFAPDLIDDEQGLRLIETQGAWMTQGFQSLLQIPPKPELLTPVVPPRPGHMALLLAAGIADGAVIETDEYGKAAIRSTTEHIEQIARVDVESSPNDPQHQIKKTTIRLKPTTTLTLLSQNGTVVQLNGDDAQLNFIGANKKALASYLNTKFRPRYDFNFNGIRRFLDGIQLKGKHRLYTAQKHVIGAITRGFEMRKGILLAGSMGVGKTAIGGGAAIALASGIVKALQGKMRPDQVVFIVAPPHLIDKWKRELLSIHPNIYLQQLDRHEDIKAFMDGAARIGSTIPKIGLIKRDMTKLGTGWQPAVVWRAKAVALWRHGQLTPMGYENHPRVVKHRVPLCPHCGSEIEPEGKHTPSAEEWLKKGKRTCTVCLMPLWEEVRDRGSQPKSRQKYASKNPRYRIDEYVKRLYPNRVFLLIWDEVHEAQAGDTGNGEAFGRMAGLSQKVLAMTGTPFNGKSSSLFNLEYHLNPRVRQHYAWGGAPRLSRKARGDRDFQTVLEDDGKQRGRAESRWVENMGIREQVIEERPSYDKETGAYTGTTTYERPYNEAPGISPLLVAEMLDHTLFFALEDLGKWLPELEESAVPVEMDADTWEQYDRTRQQLKDYLIQRRWEGDTSFRGAYLQWSMGWLNSAFRPYEVIHNIKHPLTHEKIAHCVADLPSYGEDRLYAKEVALIDLIRTELAQQRPLVIYVRQTDKRDIQPRLEALIRAHVPEAKPFILKNTVDAEQRERVIERELTRGMNVMITNPELVKTGMDLLFAPTLVFFEITYNLSTMMQAAARSRRLNQTHKLCKVIYLYYTGTMEHVALQLMSRKQRAAKLLTGSIGMTGLDALTEGESGFEEALLAAIGQEPTLVDSTVLFKASTVVSEIDHEDASYWTLDDGQTDSNPTLPTDDLLPSEKVAALPPTVQTERTALIVNAESKTSLRQVLEQYLTEHSQLSELRCQKLAVRLAEAFSEGVHHPLDTTQLLTVGIPHADFQQSSDQEQKLTHWVQRYLRAQNAVLPEMEATVATRLVELGKRTLNPVSAPLSGVDTLHGVLEQRTISNVQASSARVLPKARKRKLNLLALPDDTSDYRLHSEPAQLPSQLAAGSEPLQLPLF